MVFQTWQVGLDIQNGQLCALAVQRRRHGWQLRHWWQHALPHDTLSHGRLQRPDPVVTLLRRWRQQLPRYISLRVGFPPQLILQRQMNLPKTSLCEAEHSRYVAAAARRFFPIELPALTIDYRQLPRSPAQLAVTAAPREALQSWLTCFTRARLTPHIVELTPAALCVLSERLGSDNTAAWVHRAPDHWLWYSASHPEQWGWLASDDSADFEAFKMRCLPDTTQFFYSSTLSGKPPEGTAAGDPFAAIALKQPPLPAHVGAFALAAGLALRPEDT